MRIRAQRQMPTQRIQSGNAARPGRSQVVLSPELHPILQLQRTIGNRAVQRLLQASPQGLGAGSSATASAPSAHGFRRMGMHLNADADGIRQIAGNGTAGASGPLPHLDRIQRSFGPGHDLGSVMAHVGGQAAEVTGCLGAEAYASGERVAFRSVPSLHTAAHEAAHVVQQRAGVQLADGVGQTGDKYEQHADQVANEVVAGRSAVGILAEGVAGNDGSVGVQKQAVQFWGHEHKQFTREAVERWNVRNPSGTNMHIAEDLKNSMVDCSDDPDYSGRALTGTVSDLRIYWDFIVSGKKRRQAEYAKADPAKKKELYDAAVKSVCASEGPTHGEGNRPNYGSGGSAVNHEYMMSQIRWASRLTFGGFMSRAGAGQLGDAMHCAQDRGSHCEGNRYEGHDDVRDKLGIDGYDTDDPNKNKTGKVVSDRNSDIVLAEFAKLRNE